MKLSNGIKDFSKIGDEVLDSLVSIIIPVYNAEKYINKATNSVLNSTYKNIEIILIDDGSIDCSNKLCKKLESTYDNVKLLEKNNGGASSARNYGLNYAKGDYILFLDADDELLEDSVEGLLEICIRENVDMVIPDRYLELNEQGKLIQKFHFNQKLMTTDPVEFAVKTMIGHGRGWRSHSLLFRSKIITENDIRFAEGFIAEDMMFNLDFMMYANKLAYYHKNTVIYRKHATSVTATFHKNMYENYLFMDEKVKNFLRTMNFSEKSINEIKNELFRRNIITYLFDICSYKNTDSTKNKKTLFYTILKENNVQRAFTSIITRVYFNNYIISLYYIFMTLLLKFHCKALSFYITLLISSKRR